MLRTNWPIRLSKSLAARQKPNQKKSGLRRKKNFKTRSKRHYETASDSRVPVFSVFGKWGSTSQHLSHCSDPARHVPHQQLDRPERGKAPSYAYFVFSGLATRSKSSANLRKDIGRSGPLSGLPCPGTTVCGPNFESFRTERFAASQSEVK